MRIRGLVDEDFVNYKKPSMFISTCTCDFKCCREQGLDISICQNSELSSQPIILIDNEAIYERYIKNDITSAVVVGGLEPFKQTEELYWLIECFRNHACSDDFVIYTGYYPYELLRELKLLNEFDNIIIKFGRYKQNIPSKFDDVLGVELSSNNQYALNLRDVLK